MVIPGEQSETRGTWSNKFKTCKFKTCKFETWMAGTSPAMTRKETDVAPPFC